MEAGEILQKAPGDLLVWGGKLDKRTVCPAALRVNVMYRRLGARMLRTPPEWWHFPDKIGAGQPAPRPICDTPD